MSQILGQGQSALPLIAGPVVQASDGKTAMPGLLAAGATLTASATGTTGTFVTSSASGAAAGQIIAFKTGANTAGFAYTTGVSGSGKTSGTTRSATVRVQR